MDYSAKKGDTVQIFYFFKFAQKSFWLEKSLSVFSVILQSILTEKILFMLMLCVLLISNSMTSRAI